MPDFVLKTETERQMYVEALLHCIDHATLTETEVLEDLCELLPGLGDRAADACTEFIRHVRRNIAAYRAGVQDHETTTKRLVRLFNDPLMVNDVAPPPDSPARTSRQPLQQH